METMPSKPVAIGEERKRAHSAHQTMPRLLDSPLESSLRQQQTNGPAWSVSRGCCSDTKSLFLGSQAALDSFGLHHTTVARAGIECSVECVFLAAKQESGLS